MGEAEESKGVAKWWKVAWGDIAYVCRFCAGSEGMGETETE